MISKPQRGIKWSITWKETQYKEQMKLNEGHVNVAPNCSSNFSQIYIFVQINPNPIEASRPGPVA